MLLWQGSSYNCDVDSMCACVVDLTRYLMYEYAFNVWYCFSEKGPNTYIIKFPIRAIEMYIWLITNSEPYNSMTDTQMFSVHKKHCVEDISDF